MDKYFYFTNKLYLDAPTSFLSVASDSSSNQCLYPRKLTEAPPHNLLCKYYAPTNNHLSSAVAPVFYNSSTCGVWLVSSNLLVGWSQNCRSLNAQNHLIPSCFKLHLLHFLSAVVHVTVGFPKYIYSCHVWISGSSSPTTVLALQV